MVIELINPKYINSYRMSDSVLEHTLPYPIKRILVYT